MANQNSPQAGHQSTPLYQFILREDTEFRGRFNHTAITIKPICFNGKPLKLDVTKISKILRVNDLGWKVSQRLKYFIFELTDGAKITGLPITKTLFITMPFLESCEVLWMNIQEVTLVT
jgi:hypothetical protein